MISLKNYWGRNENGPWQRGEGKNTPPLSFSWSIKREIYLGHTLGRKKTSPDKMIKMFHIETGCIFWDKKEYFTRWHYNLEILKCENISTKRHFLNRSLAVIIQFKPVPTYRHSQVCFIWWWCPHTILLFITSSATRSFVEKNRFLKRLPNGPFFGPGKHEVQ